MFVDFLEKSAVEDFLAKVGKSLGFSLKHSTLTAGQGCARVGSPLWWWYEYEPSGGEDSKAASKVFLYDSGTFQSGYGLKSYYIESTSMLEDVLATREFVVGGSIRSNRYVVPPHISNPFAGTRSLEELQIKLDLLGEKKRESHDSK